MLLEDTLKFHDLLNDVDKEVVMSDITQWIAAHLQKA
jgi:hypothetical protein